MITAQALRKTFGEREAVKEVSFSIGKGEIVALLGPNGAGKTTTMRMLTGFYEPTSGTATIGGFDVRKNRRAVQELVGYLPESASSYPDMLVADFLQFVADSRNLPPEKARAGIDRAVQVTGLQEYLETPIMYLSKGYRQRVGLASALLHDPPVLILDEPTSGLDPNQIAGIRQLIRELAKEKTVILSTHILKEVEETCERAIIIADGRIVLDDRLDRIQRMREGREVWEFALKGNVPGALEKIRTILAAGENVSLVSANDTETRFTAETSSGFNEKLFSLAVSEKWVLRELFMQKLSMEEIFARLTTKGS
ncbi:MAG: ABC transporter ATP-binding protein [Turneriella sp.]|nr:ABC transporter ATP-binding protein [Turneriella sp.]